MTVQIHDIDVKTRMKNGNYLDKDKNIHQLLTLEEYDSIAQKCIMKFTNKFIAARMLADEDAISFVREGLMLASCRFNGYGNYKGYLGYCGRRVILRWLNFYSKNKNKMEISDENLETTCFTTTTPMTELIHKQDTQFAHELLDSSCLTERQRQCLKLIYIDGYSQAEIARLLNISREAVRQLINTGIAKLKVIYV